MSKKNPTCVEYGQQLRNWLPTTHEGHQGSQCDLLPQPCEAADQTVWENKALQNAQWGIPA